MEEITYNAVHETIMGILGIGMSIYLLHVIFRIIQMRNQERIALIDQKMDPSLAGSYFRTNKTDNRKMGWVFMATAGGIFTGHFVHLFFEVPEFVAYSTMILLFCGAALLIIHRLDNK